MYNRITICFTLHQVFFSQRAVRAPNAQSCRHGEEYSSHNLNIYFCSFFFQGLYSPPPPHEIPGKEECAQKCLLLLSRLLLLCCPELQKWERGSPSLIQEKGKQEIFLQLSV